MDPLYLASVEHHVSTGGWKQAIDGLRAEGRDVPQILHLFAFKPDRTDHLARFSEGVMRGPSPLSPGQRELIAAFTSRRNGCVF